jgi:high-affinity iron transporter
VLILAAITASFVGVRRRMRRPVLIGAAMGLVVSMITWVLAQTLLKTLEQYDKVGFFSAQVLGLGLLGLTSVYREGFETVLFLQSLQLSAGTAAVVEGAGLGLGLTLLVAVVTFALQRKLPYKKMLIVTGVMIGFVLVVMVGQTARTMQGTGWLPISPLDVALPYWSGLWFGVYPTLQTIGAQLGAAVFVIGSYFLAREVKVHRRVRRAPSSPRSPGPAAAPPPHPATPGTRGRP